MTGPGRPTKYDPAQNKQITKICRLGATDEEIADFLDVDTSTVYNWKNQHPEFLEAIKKGKLLADAEVADKLFKRATGYKHKDVDIKMFEGAIIQTELTKHYPPDTAAAIYWLNNRRPKDWKNKVDFDMGKSPIVVTISGQDEPVSEKSNDIE